jgi:hypothetical protein
VGSTDIRGRAILLTSRLCHQSHNRHHARRPTCTEVKLCVGKRRTTCSEFFLPLTVDLRDPKWCGTAEIGAGGGSRTLIFDRLPTACHRSAGSRKSQVRSTRPYVRGKVAVFVSNPPRVSGDVTAYHSRAWRGTSVDLLGRPGRETRIAQLVHSHIRGDLIEYRL